MSRYNKIRNQPLFIEILNTTIKFSSDDDDELAYMRLYYDDWLTEPKASCCWSIHSFMDYNVFNALGTLRFLNYEIFGTCPASIAMQDASVIILCNDIFPNYRLIIDYRNHHINIIRDIQSVAKEEMRFVGHVINEVAALYSYLDGYYKAHAAACVIGDKGVLIEGNKGAGKTTLLIQLLVNGAHFINNDITRITVQNDKTCMYAWPAKINIGEGTITDIPQMKRLLECGELHEKITINEDDQKREIFRYDFKDLFNGQMQLEAELKCIIKPSFSTQNSRCELKGPIAVTSSDIFSPIEDTWLPVVSSKLLKARTGLGVFDIKIPTFEFYYGPSKTCPGKYLYDFIDNL